MRSSARYLQLVLLALLAAAALPGQLRPQERTKSEAAFKELASLVGDWEGIHDGVPIKLRYTLTADRSALMLVEEAGDSAT